MRSNIKKTVCIISALLLMPFGSVYAKDNNINIYVSPQGDDNAGGGIYSPLKTLEGAKEKIKQIREKNSYDDKKITVLFREGEYQWDNTVLFDETDSGTKDLPVIYRAFPNEKPVFTGGIKISAEEFESVSDSDIRQKLPDADKVRQINIKTYFDNYFGYSVSPEKYAQVLDDYNDDSIKRPMYSFDDEQLLWPARFPNKSGGAYEDINPHTVYLKGTSQINTNGSFVTYSGDDEGIRNKILNYAGRDDTYIFGNLQYAFYHYEKKAGINSDATISVPSLKYIQSKNDIRDNITSTTINDRGFYLFNIIEELDANGEYYIDADTGLMYVYRDSFDNTTLNVPMFENDYMIEFKNTSYINFEGITFENTKGSAVKVSGGESVVFKNCDFKNIGISAAVIGNGLGQFFHRFGDTYTGSYEQYAVERYEMFNDESYQTAVMGKNHGLDSCIIRNTGRCGVELSGGNVYTDDECNYYVKNCDIKFTGSLKRSYAGAISINYSHGVYIENNTLAHNPGALINGSAYKMTVKSNELYDSLTESYDNSLIYLNYQTPALDIQFINNYFHDVPSETPLNRVKIWAPPQRGAIAFDNSPVGGGVVIKSNIFANLPYGAWYANGYDISDNVFVNVFNPIKGGGSRQSEADYPLQASWAVYADSNERTFRSGLTEAEKNDNISLQSEETYENILSMPIFAGGDIESTVRPQWYDKYPSFMAWMDITEKNSSNGKGFAKIKDNIMINVGGGTEEEPCKYELCYYHYRPDELTDRVYTGADAYNYEISNNLYTDDTAILADYANGDYSMADGSININDIGSGANAGADKYTGSDINSGSGDITAIEYLPTKIVNISGSSYLLNEGDEVTMILKDKQGNIVHMDQTAADSDNRYSFRFETENDNIGECNLTVYAGGNLFCENIFTTSEVNKVMKPKCTFTKNQDGNALLEMTVENKYLIPDYTYYAVIAGFDDKGNMCAVKTIMQGTAHMAGITEEKKDIVIESEFTKEEYEKISVIKAYLWNGLDEMIPLAQVQSIK